MSDREPKVVHEWEAVNAGGLARSIRLYSNGSVYLLDKDGKHYDPAPSLVHQELARLAARCKRLEEALDDALGVFLRSAEAACRESGGVGSECPGQEWRLFLECGYSKYDEWTDLVHGWEIADLEDK